MKDLGPLLGQSPVEQDRSRLLRGLVHREVLADHRAEEMRERTRLQLSCRAFTHNITFHCYRNEEKTKGTAPRPGTGKERARGGNDR